MSAYGGVVATNRPVTAAMAEAIGDVFTEVVVAPDFEAGALEVLHPEEEHPPAALRRAAPGPAG